MTEEDKEQYPERNGHVAFEVAQHHVEMQLGAIDAIDTKVGLVFGFASAVLTAPAAFLALREGSLPTASLVLLSLGFVAYAICAIKAYEASRIQNFKHGPKLDELWEQARGDYAENLLEWWAATGYKKSYDENRPRWLDKGNRASQAMAILGGETVLVTAGLLVALLS